MIIDGHADTLSRIARLGAPRAIAVTSSRLKQSELICRFYHYLVANDGIGPWRIYYKLIITNRK